MIHRPAATGFLISGLLGATAPALAALEVAPGLALDGYVESVFTLAEGGDALAADPLIGFDSRAQVALAYAVDQAVAARIELMWTADGVELEEAHVTWQLDPGVSLIAGRFENWIGWEGADAPELWRVNGAYVTSGGTVAAGNGDELGIVGVETTGLGLVLAPGERLGLSLFAVDHIYADPAGRAGESISFGASGQYEGELAQFQIDLMYGRDEAGGGTDDVLGIDLWTEIHGWREMRGWLFAADVNLTSIDGEQTVSALLAANYALATVIPMSLTGMIDWIDPGSSTAEGLELALALLTNPTDETGFALNFEARYIMRDQSDADEFGVFIEALAVMP